MLFQRFKLQLPKDFRKGVEVPEPLGVHPPEDVCACGDPVSSHSTATIRTVKRVRFPHDVLRCDIRWRACTGHPDRGFGNPCGCPGFWKA